MKRPTLFNVDVDFYRAIKVNATGVLAQLITKDGYLEISPLVVEL